jgi:hypothetical protein
MRAAGLALFAAALGWASETSAQHGVRLDVQGSCPRADELRRALEARRGLVEDPAAPLVVQVRRGADASQVRLHRPDGARLLERAIRSDDCQALAEAFAVIIEAELGGLGPSRGARPDQAALLQSVDPPAPAAAVGLSAPPTAPRLRWSVGLGGGFAVVPDPGLAAGFGELDVSLRARSWGRLALRAAAVLQSPATQVAPTESVEWLQASFRLEAGFRLEARRLWVEPRGGVVLALDRVTATSLPDQPSQLRLHPGVAAGIALGLPLRSGLSLRAESTFCLFPLTDSYQVDPVGEVGRSPRLTFALGMGAQLDFGQ